MLGERLGKWNFWLMFVGVLVGFFPMHISGLLGMPRRIYTYAPDMGWNALNLITTIGAYIFALGVIVLVINVVASLRRGELAGPNPWDASTLEWATSSPPPPYNFATIPRVASRHPLWEARLREMPDRSTPNEGPVLAQGKETLGTTNVDARPNIILQMPEDTFLPLLLALALTGGFCGLLIHSWLLAGLSGAAGIAFVYAWTWPRAKLGETRAAPNV
jgi:heme/copper-type cytochrome/quinol oxidase subunit 1